MKKILVVTNLAPTPVFGGDILRLRKIAEYLATGAAVTCVCSGGLGQFDDHGVTFLSMPSNNYIDIIKNIFKSIKNITKPLQTYLFYNKRIDDYIKEYSSDYDVILFHLVRTYPYFSSVKGAKIIIDMTDAISMTYFRIGFPKSMKEIFFITERYRLYKLEKYIADNLSYNPILINDTDANFLGSTKCVVVPNGTTFPSTSMALEDIDFQSVRNKGVFIGNCNSASNRSALIKLVKQILPKILQKNPQFEITVVGNVPKKLQSSLEHKNVFFLGNISDFSQIAGCFGFGFAPIEFGAGLQNKVLDYIGIFAIPILSKIASEGFCKLSDELQVCHSDDDYVHSVLNFSEDEYYRTVDCLRRHAHQHYSWDKQLSKLKNMDLLNDEN